MNHWTNKLSSLSFFSVAFIPIYVTQATLYKDSCDMNDVMETSKTWNLTGLSQHVQ